MAKAPAAPDASGGSHRNGANAGAFQAAWPALRLVQDARLVLNAAKFGGGCVAETSRYSHYAFVVPFRDVGMRGEMHSAAYITYAEEALARFWSARATQKTDPLFYVSKVACTIHKGLRFGDDVSTAVRVSKIGGKSAGFAILLSRGDDLVAEAEIVWTACDPLTGETLPLPEPLRDWLYQYLE